MQDFVSGFRYALSGFALLTRPGIRLHVVVPLLINTFLFAGVITYGANQLNEFISSSLTGWWEWLRWLLWPLFVMIALTVVFFCFSVIANLLSAPFNGFLAAAAESHLTGAGQPPSGGMSALPHEIGRAIKSESRKIAYFAFRAVPLIALFFVPLLNIAAPVLWVLFGAWMLALEYLDYPMGNHGCLFPELRTVLKTRRQLAFGFGMGVILLTMLPVVNFIVIPAAVCGATRLWVEKIRPEFNPVARELQTNS